MNKDLQSASLSKYFQSFERFGDSYLKILEEIAASSSGVDQKKLEMMNLHESFSMALKIQKTLRIIFCC